MKTPQADCAGVVTPATVSGVTTPTKGDNMGDAVTTPASVSRVPNQPRTPLQTFRAPAEVWKAAQEKARSEGTTLAAVLRGFLERYVSGKDD